MRKIYLFMNVSLDGFFEGPGHDISGFKSELGAFSPNGSAATGAILLGHRTYEGMKAFWPTPQAAEVAPAVAKYMNEQHKLVASHQPFDPGWQNVSVISGNVVDQIRQIKQQAGGDIIMFGSNTLCVSLMEGGLVDEFQIMLNPVAFGAGTTLFAGLSRKMDLTLVGTRTFASGVVLLTYTPAQT